MKELVWVEVEKEKYVAETQYGRAIIEPASVDGLYRPRLELTSGQVVYNNFDVDIESAMEIVYVKLPLFDQRTGRFDECGFVEETLNWCQQLISKETDANHWQRIEYIKAWIARKDGQSYEIVNIPIPEMPPIEFNWIEDGSTFYIDTVYGRLIIIERRTKQMTGGIRHEAFIKHDSGAILNCYKWVDFMEAEAQIRRILKALSNPGVYEDYLQNIDFTLAICQRMLPESTDAIHFVRLQNLASTIHEILE